MAEPGTQKYINSIVINCDIEIILPILKEPNPILPRTCSPVEKIFIVLKNVAPPPVPQSAHEHGIWNIGERFPEIYGSTRRGYATNENFRSARCAAIKRNTFGRDVVICCIVPWARHSQSIPTARQWAQY